MFVGLIVFVKHSKKINQSKNLNVKCKVYGYALKCISLCSGIKHNQRINTKVQGFYDINISFKCVQDQFNWWSGQVRTAIIKRDFTIWYKLECNSTVISRKCFEMIYKNVNSLHDFPQANQFRIVPVLWWKLNSYNELIKVDIKCFVLFRFHYFFVNFNFIF